MDYSKWIDLAVERIGEREGDNSPFELKELFTGEEWNRLSKGEKSTFGREFANIVRSGDIDGVRFAPISKNNRHNKYEAF